MQTQDMALAVGKDRRAAVRMLGRNVYVRKLLRSGGNVLIPEQSAEETYCCEVVGVGPRCSAALEVGDTVILPNVAASDRMWREPMGDPLEVVVDEDEIIARVDE